VGDSHNINNGMRAADGSGDTLGLQEKAPSRGMRYLVVGSRYEKNSVSITCGATHAGRILFDTKRKRENSRVWPFEVRVMLLLDRSRA